VNDAIGLAIAVVGGAGLLAVPSNRLGQRLRVPAPAIFLLAAAMAVHFPGAGPTSASASDDRSALSRAGRSTA
jgi:potassium/hydrogen antiporter